MLKDKIEKEINEKYWNKGHMGAESVSINLTLSDAEKEEFLNSLSDSYDYDLDGNNLSILFSENIS
ncbi:MAG: hypothetical protein IJH34_16530 [Romboutsia sp.]|nr:hypothetical protein [Romboutsia sp.]